MRPPQHRADAPVVFIHRLDPAWDRERIEAEQARMVEAGEDPDHHPVTWYLDGWTRFDLEAEVTFGAEVVKPSAYLRQDARRWLLRRLPWDEYYEVHDAWEAAVRAGKRPYGAFLRAANLGLRGVEGRDAPTLQGTGKRLTYADMQVLFELGRREHVDDLVIDIGAAVYTASMPLTEAEGKA